MEHEDTTRDEGQDPQVIRVLPHHYTLFNSLTIALFALYAVMMLGGCLSAISIMPAFVTLFEGMNLTLPLPTKIFIMMTKSGGGLLLIPATGAALALVLTILAVYLIGKARRDFIGAVITGMAAYLCLLVLMIVILALFMMAVFLPLSALIGNLN